MPRQLGVPLLRSKTLVGPVPRFRAPARHILRGLPGNDLEAVSFQSGGRRLDDRFPGIIRPELNGCAAVNEVDIRSGRERDTLAGGKLSGAGLHRERHRNGICYLPPGGIRHLHGDVYIIRAVSRADGLLVRGQLHLCRSSLHGPFRRGNAFELIPVPVPGALGDAEIIHNAHAAAGWPDAAVVKPAPDRLPHAPGIAHSRLLVLLHIPPARRVRSRPLAAHGTVFRHHAGPSGRLHA